MAVLEGEHIPGLKTVQRKLWRFIGTKMTVVFRNRERPEHYKTLSGLDKIPKKRFPRKKWQLVYAVANVDVAKFINIHHARHMVDVPTDEADISYDGVAVTNSCGRSFEVMSCKFSGCRQASTLVFKLSDMSKPRLWQIRHQPLMIFHCTCPFTGVPRFHRHRRARLLESHVRQRGDAKVT